MQSFVQLIISILDTIRAWITRRDTKIEKKQESVAEANNSLKTATESGDVADLYKAAKKLGKAHNQ